MAQENKASAPACGTTHSSQGTQAFQPSPALSSLHVPARSNGLASQHNHRCQPPGCFPPSAPASSAPRLTSEITLCDLLHSSKCCPATLAWIGVNLGSAVSMAATGQGPASTQLRSRHPPCLESYSGFSPLSELECALSWWSLRASMIPVELIHFCPPGSVAPASLFS